MRNHTNPTSFGYIGRWLCLWNIDIALQSSDFRLNTIA
jgi:hypothetical protein